MQGNVWKKYRLNELPLDGVEINLLLKYLFYLVFINTYLFKILITFGKYILILLFSL